MHNCFLPQPEVAENYSYLFNSEHKYLQRCSNPMSLCLSFIHTTCSFMVIFSADIQYTTLNIPSPWRFDLMWFKIIFLLHSLCQILETKYCASIKDEFLPNIIIIIKKNPYQIICISLKLYYSTETK